MGRPKKQEKKKESTPENEFEIEQLAGKRGEGLFWFIWQKTFSHFFAPEVEKTSSVSRLFGKQYNLFCISETIP